MPIVNVKLVENVFSDEQKRELLPRLTDAIEAVYPGIRDVTFVTIEEIRESEWGLGGQPVTAEKVVDHARQNLEQSA
jgi:4-oxalocrotonate tautomerase